MQPFLQEVDELLANLRCCGALEALLEHPSEPRERVGHFIRGWLMKDAPIERPVAFGVALVGGLNHTEIVCLVRNSTMIEQAHNRIAFLPFNLSIQPHKVGNLTAYPIDLNSGIA